MNRKTYFGSDIDVSFDSSLCTHAAECVKGLPSVFDTKKRPWVNPTEATTEEIIEVIRKCPSGALQYHEK